MCYIGAFFVFRAALVSQNSIHFLAFFMLPFFLLVLCTKSTVKLRKKCTLHFIFYSKALYKIYTDKISHGRRKKLQKEYGLYVKVTYKKFIIISLGKIQMIELISSLESFSLWADCKWEVKHWSYSQKSVKFQLWEILLQCSFSIFDLISKRIYSSTSVAKLTFSSLWV